VSQKPEEADNSERLAANGKLVVVSETLRSTSQTSASKKDDSEEKGEHMSLFWRVFGGTILSISSLIVITLYNNLSDGIANIRTELNNERTAREDLVKKEDFNTRSTNIFDRIRTLDAQKVEMEGLRERVTANAATMESLKKDTTATVEGLKKEVATTVDGLKNYVVSVTDQVKKDETVLDLLKERIAAVESVRKDVAGIDVLKDKLANTSADMKALRDEVAKIHQEADRSRSTDLERKASQDLLYKQVEDTLKEMQKGLQDCREKLARLEGAQPTATPRPTTTPSKP